MTLTSYCTDLYGEDDEGGDGEGHTEGQTEGDQRADDGTDAGVAAFDGVRHRKWMIDDVNARVVVAAREQPADAHARVHNIERSHATNMLLEMPSRENENH